MEEFRLAVEATLEFMINVLYWLTLYCVCIGSSLSYYSGLRYLTKVQTTNLLRMLIPHQVIVVMLCYLYMQLYVWNRPSFVPLEFVAALSPMVFLKLIDVAFVNNRVHKLVIMPSIAARSSSPTPG